MRGGGLLLRLGAVLMLFCLFGAGEARAAVLAQDGALLRWLDGEVAPALAETLTRHPNFRGETIDFLSLRNGVPQARSDALSQAVVAQLRARLLAVAGVRLAVGGARGPCAIGPSVHYAIGIEVTAGEGGTGAVTLAMLDVTEGIWVGGTSHEWRGRLAVAERRALARVVAVGRPGSVDAPLAGSRTEAIAEALQAQLGCTLPQGLDGPVHLAVPDAAELGRIAASLRTSLATSPLGVLTPRAEAATWLLTLEDSGGGGPVRELGLFLGEPDRETTQRVASVFVSGLDPAQPGATAARAVERPEALRPAEPPILLGPLQLEPVAPRGVCDRDGGVCAEVSLELQEPAFLLVFGTGEERVRPLDCGREPERSEPGERRYRLQVPEGVESGRPGAGLYVIATRDPALARRVHQALRDAPGACGRDPDQDRAQWLSAFTGLLDADALSWRAIHLTESNGRLRRL
jgi:hypothetical protein